MNGAISLLPYTPSRNEQEELHYLHSKQNAVSQALHYQRAFKRHQPHRTAYFSADCLLLSNPRIVGYTSFICRMTQAVTIGCNALYLPEAAGRPRTDRRNAACSTFGF